MLILIFISICSIIVILSMGKTDNGKSDERNIYDKKNKLFCEMLEAMVIKC